MAVYVWRGINNAGKQLKGVRDSDSPKNLRLILRKEGILVTELVEESLSRKNRRGEIDFKRFFRRISVSDVAITTRQLATLLKAGIPLVECLTAMLDQLDQPELKATFTQTRDKVNEGGSFADSLAEHPKVFSPLFINMVAAGEASGTLERVLARLADFLEDQSKLQSKVFGALAYPAFMVVMAIGVIATMMTVVVPKVTAIFDDFHQALPWYTQLLIHVSNFVSGFWWAIIGVVGGSIWAFRRWKSTKEGLRKWDLFVLKVPLFGHLVVLIGVSRFARTLATLLASGVQLLPAMEITRNVLGNTELMRVIEEARTSVREGESIAAPIKRSGRFPPIVTHMIAIGERSGQLEEMLENVANTYDTQVENRVNALTSLLQPLIIVLMGGMAGAIAFSVLMPLIQMNEFVG